MAFGTCVGVGLIFAVIFKGIFDGILPGNAVEMRGAGGLAEARSLKSLHRLGESKHPLWGSSIPFISVAATPARDVKALQALEWLVEAGLSPASRGMYMVNMNLLRGLPKAGGGCFGSGAPTIAMSSQVVAPIAVDPAPARSPSEVQEIPLVEATRKVPESFGKCQAETLSGQRKKSKVSGQHKSRCKGEKSMPQVAEGEKSDPPNKRTPDARPKPKSVRELCSARLRVDGRDFHAILVITSLGDKVDGLRKEVQRLKDGGNPNTMTVTEQRASEAQSLADHLKVKLEEATQRRESLEEELGEIQKRFFDSWDQLFENELLKLTRAMEALWDDLPKQAIDNYKKLRGFEMGLVRMGRVSLEYGYQLALVRFRARYPDLEVEEDPFKELSEDANVPIAVEQPFDDSPPPLEE
ncbi:hypothetical protein B296_00026183 [Ensete ventricosum]|uniref:Uncharacterized protein n=1 Tax=Ensete ventricosum TaxID=4639 RepID=A0A426ZYE7_ENSVE|nr:hypothetical protein B296_00026183 [Ensete ventricosum]